jgi:hypothetical protein
MRPMHAVRGFVGVTLATALLAGCGGEPPAGDPPSTAIAQQVSTPHLMPMRSSTEIEQLNFRAPRGAHLNYYGGPTLTHVNVIPVYWNANVQYQSSLNAFYADVPGFSTIYTSLLKQYSAIGTGTRGAPYVAAQATASLTDAQVQSFLTSLFNAGKLPLPNASNYYPVHFDPGTSITDPSGAQSCVVFCAYHGTYVYNGVNVNYGVVPDQGGGCAGGCGGNAQRVNNLTSVSSHELVEATTDPAVGLATVYGPPLSWYDPNYGEIGDICNGQQASITANGHTYVVQTEFSNSARNCVVK